jgi:hypothetical protein
MLCAMCRNIRVLYNFEPPTTDDEMRAAAIQFVRKVSGVARASETDRAAFETAVVAVHDATRVLLHQLTARAPLRTRQGEIDKARARWRSREARVRSGG